MNLITVFITGLSIGGLSCLAVQGGLLASLAAVRPSKTAPLVFLAAKLFAYSLLGFLLGLFGSALHLSSSLQSYIQMISGVYMILVALNMLEIHPVFRYVMITPPRFLARLLKNQSRSEAYFAPAFLGVMTIFIPCGTTLAMEALAVSTASAVSGALIMAAFVLGTMPLFYGIGYLTTLLGGVFKSVFTQAAAIVIILLGLVSIHGSLVSLGHPIFAAAPSAVSAPVTQNVTISITSRGYSPDFIRTKAGVPLTLTVTNVDSYSCASAFRIPSYNISANLAPGQSKTFTITPDRSGRIPFSCSMGMYTGVIEVL